MRKRKQTKPRQTSIDCYNQIKSSGLLSKRRWEIYDIVFRYGAMTSNETFDYSELKGVDGYRHNANARMTELRELGVVQELGTTICSKTGKKVILWDVTARLPVKAVIGKTTKKERIDLALNAFDQLLKVGNKPTKNDIENVGELIKNI